MFSSSSLFLFIWTSTHILYAKGSYEQWVSFLIENKNDDYIRIQNGRLSWGKWYEGEKDNEIQYIDRNIEPGNATLVNACGRSNSPSGTEGSFDLSHDGVVFGSIYFNSPWGSHQNRLVVDNIGGCCIIKQVSEHKKTGALGEVIIYVDAHPNRVVGGWGHFAVKLVFVMIIIVLLYAILMCQRFVSKELKAFRNV